MPLREEWKPKPICIDSQAVVGVELKTELAITLEWAIWVQVTLVWSGFELKKKRIKI